MVTYILLRDNKEQGPMRLEDLLEIGLKPYDLVWLPGKSAAWRYPSEIEELKPYAPVVEEQPFDRFYKKENEVTAGTETGQPVQPQKTVVAATGTTTLKNKFVAVTMPAGQKKTVVEKPAAAVTTKPVQPSYDEYKAYMPASTQQQAPEKKAVAQTTVHEQLLAGETNMAAQAEKIASYTERYEQTYHQRKNKWNKKALLIKYGRIAAVVVVVLGIAVIFAFNVGKPETNPTILADNSAASTIPDNNPEPVTADNNTPPVIPVEPSTTEEEPTNTPPPVVQQAPVSIKEKMPKEPAPVVKTSDKKPDLSKPVTDKKGLDLSRTGSAKAILDKQSAITTMDTRDAYAYESYTTANNGERSRKVRDNETAVKTNDNNTGQAKTNSNPFYKGPEEKTMVSNTTPTGNTVSSHTDVKVVANEYKVVPFGGIRNLQLTVQNRSGEPLEKVVVDVEYKKRDGGVFKTKTVEFKNIAPKSSSVLKIDDTNRGVDVAYHIRKVVK